MKIILLLTFIFQFSAHAGSDETPLKSTQNLLRDRSERSIAIEDGGDEAKKADQFIEQAFGENAKTKDSIYDAAADVMKTLEQRSGEDPEKMKLILSEALKNPGAFLNSLSDKEKAKIRGIAEDQQSKKNTKP